MLITLPPPIAAYFDAERTHDADALARCFTELAVVRDEGGAVMGNSAIRQWTVEARNRYQHTVEPVGAVERDGKTVVVAKVSGNFPGSPLQLEHIFQLDGSRIASLEIR